MAGGLGGYGTKKYSVGQKTAEGGGKRVRQGAGGQWQARAPARPKAGNQGRLGSPQSGPSNPFTNMFPPSGGGGGGAGYGGGGSGPGGGGGGGGGGGYRGPTTNFDFSKMQQNLKPNEFQTKAYGKMEELYDEVPDYYKTALANSRMAGSMGIENELAAAGGRGFGPGSGFTGAALKDYGRGLNQQLMGGQLQAAQKTFADRAGLAGQMGGLGTGIAGNLAQMYGNNIGAYNAMANYALGNERNQIGWYDSQTRAQQGWMSPMMNMMGMMMQSGAFV